MVPSSMDRRLWLSLVFLTVGVTSATWKSKVQVWIYPAAVTCGAKQEYQDGRGLFAIKPEYFTIGGDGRWSWLNETAGVAETCNGYSPQNVASIKANSLEQWVTVSAAHPSMVAFFANNVQKTTAISTWTDFCVSSGFTGVELDWEGYGDWTPAEYTAFKQFITSLGNALHAKGKKLMINGPPIYNAMSQGWYEWKYEDFGALPLDYMSVMAYDYMYDHGCGTPVQPIDWLEGIIDWTLAKYPYLDRIVMGIPSYGYSGVTDSYNVERTNKAQATKITGYTNAARDTNSQEMTWVSGGKSHFYVDTVALNAKRTAIENKGIKQVAVFHLGGNDWFTGKEPEGGYVGSTAPSSAPTPSSQTPSSKTPASTQTPSSKMPSQTSVTPVPSSDKPQINSTGISDGAAGEMCCQLCTEMESAKNKENSSKIPLIVAIVIITIVGTVGIVLGAFFGYRMGKKRAVANAGEVIAVSVHPGVPRAVSESFGEVPSPMLPGLQRRQQFTTGIMDSPDVSQMRKSNKNLTVPGSN